MAKRISGYDVGILATSTTILSSIAGIIGSYLFALDTLSTIGVSWLFFHTPVIFAGTNSLCHMLKLKPVTFSGVYTRYFGRKIPIQYGDKQKNIFMSVLPITSDEEDEERLTAITITKGDTDYTLELKEVEAFVRLAWRKQLSQQSGLSRTYWTKHHRPRMKTLDYANMILVLLPYIVDRKQGKSGRLLYPPRRLLELAQHDYN